MSIIEPTGYGNPDAVFVSRDVKVKSSRTVGAEGKHLKLTLEDDRGASIRFHRLPLGHLRDTLPARVDVLYHLEANECNGKRLCN